MVKKIVRQFERIRRGEGAIVHGNGRRSSAGNRHVVARDSRPTKFSKGYLAGVCPRTLGQRGLEIASKTIIRLLGKQPFVTHSPGTYLSMQMVNQRWRHLCGPPALFRSEYPPLPVFPRAFADRSSLCPSPGPLKK